MTILTKEGLVDTLHADSGLYHMLRGYGLTKHLTLIALFAVVHLNQSKYIGTCKVDAAQYLLIRLLPFVAFFALMWRYDLSGHLKFNFEIILLAVCYLVYLILYDYSNSRKNQLARYFDEAFMYGHNLNFEA